jgi:hypothetical protein
MTVTWLEPVEVPTSQNRTASLGELAAGDALVSKGFSLMVISPYIRSEWIKYLK